MNATDLSIASISGTVPPVHMYEGKVSAARDSSYIIPPTTYIMETNQKRHYSHVNSLSVITEDKQLTCCMNKSNLPK